MECCHARYLESSILESECNQVQKVHELTEHDTLCCYILLTEVIQLFHKRLNLGRRTPLVQVDSTNDTLTGLCVLFEFKSGGLQVNR